MTAENNYVELLEEVCEKLDNIDNVKEIDVLNIKNSVESIENLITDTQAKLNFQDIKEKLEKIAMQVDNCNEALLKDLYNDLNSLKETTGSVSQHLENLQNVQNLALTSGEFEEYQKQQLDLALKTNENIFNKLKELNEKTNSTANPENIKNIENQLTTLHKTLTEYIEKVVEKIELVPGVDEIGSVVSDLNSIQQKGIKQTNALIKDVEAKIQQFKSDFDNKDFENQITKISEIYDSLGMINAWIEKVGYINQSIENVYSRLGENIDFDDVSEKIDIIYENVTALNNWTMKIDKVDESVIDIQSKLVNLSNFMPETKNITNAINSIKDHFEASFNEKYDFEDMSNKLDIVYENLSAINTWASKIDSVHDNLSVINDLGNKIETINEKVTNLNNKIEEEGVTSKIDVVYENLSLLNDWVEKVDNLAQKSEEIDTKYSTAHENLNTKIDEISETLVKAAKIAEDIPNLKDKLEELSEELHAITSTTKNDTESYIYTLLDIESDFLKLHKFLDDNTKTTSNDINSLKERFSELNDDISSISIRTNKLILSADDANKEFKECLETFRTTLTELDEQRQQFNPEHKFAALDDKVNQIAILLHNTTDTAKNLNNAFLYLADWVDATGNLLNTMQSDISTFKDDNSMKIELKMLSNDVSNLLEKTENIENTFDKYKKNDIPILNEAVSYLINKIDEIDEKQQNSSIQEDIASVKEDFEAVKNGMSVLGEGMDTILSDFESLNTNVETIKSNLNDFSDLEEKLEPIKSEFNEISSIKNQLNELKEQLNNFEASFDNYKTDDISELKSSLTGIMVQLNTALTPDIDTLNERIDKLVEENQSYTTKIENLIEEKLSNQEQKINSMEEKIETLTSKFDKLIEAMSEDHKNYEVKDILNYLVTQLAATNEGITTNQQTAHKVLNEVAEKVSSFDNNINKIVSYIEEE